MLIGRRNRLWVIVVQARHEGADHKACGLKLLVNGRRHVYSPRNGFKIKNGHRPRIMVAVPAHQIEGMSAVDVWVNHALFLDFYQKIAVLVVGFEVFGQFEIPLTKRRVFQHLSVLIAVPARYFDGAERLDVEQSVLGRQEMDLVNGAPWDDDVIAVFKRDLPVHGLHPAVTFVNENHLVRIGIFEKVILGAFVRGCQANVQVIVDEQGFAAFQIVVHIRQIETLETERGEVFINRDFWLYGIRRSFFLDNRRWVKVINQRRNTRKALSANEFFLIKLPCVVAELGVPFMWYFASAVVNRHENRSFAAKVAVASCL